MTAALKCPAVIIEQTLQALREAGAHGTERVVLLLSHRPVSPGNPIVQMYIPQQEVAVDYFRIPPEGMQAMMAHLRANKLALVTQVHSHPAEAFHSQADNTWAITRHAGALSLVVPYFAAATTTGNFAEKIAAFRLSPSDEWLEIRRADLSRYFEIT